ncbi:AAA family ATPase [Frondihabitans cladoniiphilus]|uniref:AAA domain-containing protein n=1 Tax=Frondihabitans cladoniiphilus TaxID=715785 RepID=A0ABP8WDJ8_9MICO
MSDTAPAERTLTLTPLETVEAERQVFLWNGRIPMGTATIFAGRGGEGKSTFSLWVASHVTLGTLEGEYSGQPATVLLVGHEDDLGTVVKPRLIAAGADMTRVFSVTIKTQLDGLELTEVPSLVQDLGRIREAITTTGARLIIVDPLTSMMDGANLDKTADVRRVLNPFTTLAAELNVAIVALMHFRKGQGDTRDLLSGSHAFRDTARSVILFVTDEDTGQRVATVDKSNYSETRGDSFAFNLVSTLIPTNDGTDTSVARVDYLGDSTISVTDIVNKPDDVDLGEEIGAVVEYVNRHPEGVKPADVATATNLDPKAVRTYLSRAAHRGLIAKAGYGHYTPSATAPSVRALVAPVAPVALNPLSATSATEATAQQQQHPVALCRSCGFPLSPAIAHHGIHPTCDTGETA